MPQAPADPIPSSGTAPAPVATAVDAEATPGVLPELVAFLDGLAEPHILIDDQYRVVAANPAYRRRFSPDRSVVGRRCHEISHDIDVPCDQAGESCPMAAARISGRRERVLHLHHTPQGEAYVDIELAPLPDASGRTRWFIERMEPLAGAHSEAAAQGLVGRSAAFLQMLGLVARVGPAQSAALLLGESGTGKELVARAIHEASPRATRPLVVVDCASLPETLFESELFGHEKGAFTGAHAARAGLVEAASGGTLFFDEVGDIPLSMQVKLLRLLESATFRRVGSTELRRADIRVVSATHRDLTAMVADGRFREDLYYRLGVFPIHLPPLRERREDITRLASALLTRVAPGRVLKLTPAALSRLQAHHFPGNVRELRNLLERATLLSDEAQIGLPAIEQALQLSGHSGASVQAPDAASMHGRSFKAAWATAEPPAAGAPVPVRTVRASAEAEALKAALAAHSGSREALASALGISTRTLYRKLAELARAEARPPQP